MPSTAVRKPTQVLLEAKKHKSGDTYSLRLTQQHALCLDHLIVRGPATDSQLVLSNASHQMGARRCELRDSGAVELAGRTNQGVMIWRVTPFGSRVRREMAVGGIRNCPTCGVAAEGAVVRDGGAIRWMPCKHEEQPHVVLRNFDDDEDL